MSAVAVAAGATVLGGVMGAKGANQASYAAQQVASYNAQTAENEAIVLARQKDAEETSLRRQSLLSGFTGAAKYQGEINA